MLKVSIFFLKVFRFLIKFQFLIKSFDVYMFDLCS